MNCVPAFLGISAYAIRGRDFARNHHPRTCDKRATQGLTWSVHVNTAEIHLGEIGFVTGGIRVTLLANQVERDA